MTFTTPEPVISGVPYPVTGVGGGPATAFSDFVGTVEFEIDRPGAPYHIYGEGRERDGGVRIHEKNGPGGKDLRVWRVYRGPDDTFLAETSL